MFVRRPAPAEAATAEFPPWESGGGGVFQPGEGRATLGEGEAPTARPGTARSRLGAVRVLSGPTRFVKVPAPLPRGGSRAGGESVFGSQPRDASVAGVEGERPSCLDPCFMQGEN